MSTYPKFELHKSLYDQRTFLGRFRRCLDLIDPRTLFTSDKVLQESVQLLEDYKNGTLDQGITDEQLWKAQKIKQAIIHPDTGEKIFMPFRMSGFVPFGSPIVTGLLLPNQTFPQMIFWQWLNQSHNACVNYANRNATKSVATSTFIQGYFGATTAAVSISVGLSAAIRRADRFSPSARMLIQRFIPYPAVATASILNVILMRKHEVTQGIEVYDKHGQLIGTSQIAAKKALFEMAVSRAVIAAPIFIIPPAIMTQLEKTRKGIFVDDVSYWNNVIRRRDLESSIQQATSEETLHYNKGL